MSVSRTINNLWNSLTPEDKKQIEQRLGINPDSCTTRAEKYGLLAQYYRQTGGTQSALLPSTLDDDVIERPQVIVLDKSQVKVTSVNGEPHSRPSSHPVLRKNVLERGQARVKPADISFQFLQGIVKYALATGLTLSGAYIGFSAARHSDLADELRTMEENPLINAYSLKHNVENFQGLRELDFLAPAQTEIAKGREYLGLGQKLLRKAERAVDITKTLVADLPLIGRGAATLIRQQQAQISLYEQKRQEYSSQCLQYAGVGAVGGLSLGVILAGFWERKRRDR